MNVPMPPTVTLEGLSALRDARAAAADTSPTPRGSRQSGLRRSFAVLASAASLVVLAAGPLSWLAFALGLSGVLRRRSRRAPLPS